MILISIGANLPQVSGVPEIETCRRTIVTLDSLPGYRVRGLSRWFRTAPVPPSGQSNYLNAVIHLAGDARDSIDPSHLLARLQVIEQDAGRTRDGRNAARTLDIDIICIGDTIRSMPDPVLPHPRAHQRGFVLMPLRDVAPQWVHPGLGLSVDELIRLLPPQDVQPLPPIA